MQCAPEVLLFIVPVKILKSYALYWSEMIVFIFCISTHDSTEIALITVSNDIQLKTVIIDHNDIRKPWINSLASTEFTHALTSSHCTKQQNNSCHSLKNNLFV